jgi:hypothetical protein
MRGPVGRGPGHRRRRRLRGLFERLFPQALQARADLLLEPDDRNFESREVNTRHFGDRGERLRAGLWSDDTGLKVETGHFGDGREWATTVRASRPDEMPDLRGIDVGSLMRKSGLDHIDILKLDLERGRRLVFSENFESWIDTVSIFAIEVHGERCKQVFLNALKTGEFPLLSFGRAPHSRTPRRVSVFACHSTPGYPLIHRPPCRPQNRCSPVFSGCRGRHWRRGGGCCTTRPCLRRRRPCFLRREKALELSTSP